MKLYNTLSKKIEEFKPLSANKVTMYNCGPTVYGRPTIGNEATFLMNEFLKRFLEFLGFNVIQVMNITDVGHLTSDTDSGDDKIIKKALEEGKAPLEIARTYEKEFFNDLEKLNISRANFNPRATEHIKEMINMVQKLLQRGYAYEKEGTVYFDLTKFPAYGKLSGNTLEKLSEQVRSEVKKDPHKKNQHDFVLWFKAPKNHLMQWDSPWGKGYPGWHLECSAMSQKYLGPTIDLHTGGEDNIFPHHEAEIAQSEAASGQKFVRYWLHRRHILVDSQKMSKSRNNFYTLEDLEKKDFNPLIFRFFIFGTHYRSKADFSFENLINARNGLERILDLLARLEKVVDLTGTNLEGTAFLLKAKKDFYGALENDLNTPLALAAIYDLVSSVNLGLKENKINFEEAQKVISVLKEFDRIIGVIFKSYAARKKELPVEIKQLLFERKKARNEKNFKLADEIRAEISALGYLVKDTPAGEEARLKK